MKKLLSISQLIIIGLLLQLPISFAATAPLSVAPISTVLEPIVVTPEPTPTPTPATAPTRTSVNPVPLPTSVITKEAAPSGATTGATNTTTTNTDVLSTSVTPPNGSVLTSNVIPVPTDIPLVPDPTVSTPGTPSEVKVAKVENRQVFIGTILSTGTFIGGCMWMIALLMMKGGVVSRAAGSMNRENRYKLAKMYTAKKLKAYDQYIDAVMSIVNKLGHKNGPSSGDLKTLNETSAFVNLNGSKNLRTLNDHIAELASSGKPLANADQLHLKTELGRLMKADMAMT